MTRPVATLLALLVVSLPATAHTSPSPATPPVANSPAHPSVQPANLPLSFEERDPARRYAAHAGVFDVVVSPASVEFGRKDTSSVRFDLARADAHARLEGFDRLPGVVNHLIGSDRSKWRRNVPTFAGVRASGIYRGVDATYRSEDAGVVWDFHLAPHADPRNIEVTVTGATTLAIDADGSLVARTTAAEVRQDAPVVYQEIDGRRTTVEARFELRGPNRYGFAIGECDRSLALTIDPTVSFTYSFGGNGNTFLNAVAMDSQGNAYFAGSTSATDLPTVGGIDSTLGGDSDAVIGKLDTNGDVQYLTYLGGSNYDSASGIAVDDAGAAYMTGLTGISSTDDFPVTAGAAQTAFGGASDAYVAKLTPDGASLVYSTYLGGSESYDGGIGIAVDATGNAYVCGGTSQHFPVVNAIQPLPAGSAEGFVAKLNAAGSAVVYATYLGGHGDDTCTGIALTNDGGVALSGFTTSTDFPTVRPTQAANGGADDAFVAVLNATGSALSFATYLGGSDNDYAYGVAADPAGHVFASGATSSPDLPVVNAVDSSHCDESTAACPDGFVFEIDPSAGTVVYCTYLGGGGFDQCLSISVDSSGSAYVTGSTTSPDFPSVNPIPGGSGSGSEVFVTRIIPGGGVIDFSDAFGGTGNEGGYAIAVDRAGTTAIVAFTGDSGDFPAARGGGSGRQAPVERGGVLGVEFGPRKMADLVATPSLFLTDEPDGSISVTLYATFDNEGPEAAEDVRLELNLPCAIYVDAFATPRIQITNHPEPGAEALNLSGIITGPFPRNAAEAMAIRATLRPEDVPCLSGSVVRGLAEISSSAADPFPSNNRRTASAIVLPPGSAPMLTWEAPVQPGGPPSGLQLFVVAGDSRQGLTSRRGLPMPSVSLATTAGAAIAGYKVYASGQPNVQTVPANLYTTAPPSQTGADVSGAPAGSFFVVTAVDGNGQESAPSNEVGGTLPIIASVTVSSKKITAVSNGFPAGEAVFFGGVPFATAAKLKKNNTKLIQKGATVIGQTPAQLLQSLETGSAVVIIFIDPKGNGVGYVYAK